MQEKNDFFSDKALPDNLKVPLDYSLLAPGPVNLHPLVLKALALPMIHHRTPLFDKTLKRVLLGLKKIFQTEQDVYILTSTGSGGMESLVVNPLAPKDKVICIISGKFGERWAEMAEVFGCEVIKVEVPWGQVADPKVIQNILSKEKNIKAVLCQACETSTAAAHPLKELGAVIAAHPQTLFLVDGITAVGAYPIPMDEWQIDGLVAGSQKAFMLPTGLSFVSFSAKAWQVIENNPTPRFYFDIRREKKANRGGETYFSSNVSLIRALDVVLQLWEQTGLDQHFREVHERANFVRHMSQKLGFTLYAQSPSDSVTSLNVHPGADGQKMRLHLEEKYNITIMGGQDQAKGKILRIGHMGYIQEKNQLDLMEKLYLTVQEMTSYPLPDLQVFLQECRQQWQKK
ncbi:MAG: pyridoxal-phosphate-dependent aminotransferase family protein [Pseudobdellovibrionaceae bacterium]